MFLIMIMTRAFLPWANFQVSASTENGFEKNQNYDQYNVTFLVTGEDDVVLDNAVVTIQKSENGEDYHIQTEASEKKYNLNTMQGEKFLKYKFSVAAEGYLDCEGIFSFDPDEENSYFDVNTVEQEFAINIRMNADPDQYRVKIKAIDEKGNPIEGINVNMNWAVDSYSSYPQEAVNPGVYQLQKKKDGRDWIYYTFTVAKEGYRTHDGSKFCFRPDWYNPYFDVKADKHFITITITMTSLTTALENAKISAIEQLQNYKNPTDYRQVEQETIKELVATWIEKINNATTVNSVNWNLEQVKKKLDSLKTAIEYENEEYCSRIFFLTDDGQKIQADQYGVVTITNIDSGNFYITHPDGNQYTNDGTDAKWRCVYEYEDQDHPGNIAFQVIVGNYGQFAGKFVGKYTATVTLNDLGRSIPFTVRIISGRVDKIRASVDGKDVSNKTIKVMGSEKKTAFIEGRLKGTDRWVSIPWHALKYKAGGSTSVLPATGEFRTWGTSGSMTYTLDADRSVSVTVNIQAAIVKPTGVKVICPSKATVGDWNGAHNQYVGIMEGENGYRVAVTPSNASNPGVVWESLTPDVATFQPLHALGIVPKKAGTARFKVTCVDNPKVSTMVTILFQYERPLKTAEVEKNVYYAKTSDKTIDLKIMTNGKAESSQGASEQRFTWSYSTAGVVKVSDAVHYDKTSVTIPNWFSHTISILGEGTVYVTGTPYDMTENCKPVTFKVVVTDAGKENLDKKEAERVENLILGIGVVTLDKKSHIEYARSEFNKLTSTQKGLVDDDIYNILVRAELELLRLENGQSGGGGEDDGDNVDNGGGNPPEQDGSGDSYEDGENGGTAAGDEQEKTDGKENGQKKSEFHTAVTAKNAAAKTSEEPDQRHSGKRFFEVDINRLQENLERYVNEISPATKAMLITGITVAFLLGFMWRRRQYQKDKIKGRKL